MTDVICSIESCALPIFARGMCQGHYRRQRKHGDPLAGGPVQRQRTGCDIAGCDNRHYVHGFCCMHAARQKRHGDPHATLKPGRKLSPAEAFRYWMPEDPPTEGCWLWRGRTGLGYGLIGHQGSHVRASRVSYELFNGPIPDGLIIRHTCDNPPCVNPRHLLTGTHADNSRDMVERERQMRGSRQPSARLTEEDVLKIRELYSAGRETQRQIAERFGVTRSAVGLIINRQNWKHL